MAVPGKPDISSVTSHTAGRSMELVGKNLNRQQINSP
jgi:hypothetical protein